MAKRIAFTSISNSSVTVNGSGHTSESSINAAFHMPEAMTPEQFRALRDAMSRAGVDFECWETWEDGGYSFGFSARSRRGRGRASDTDNWEQSRR